MGLLDDAARAWGRLCNSSYTLFLGRKKKLHKVKIHFLPEDFPHICGVHYAFDAALRISKNELYGGRFIQAVNAGRVTDGELMGSRNWQRISGRLQTAANIEQILDGGFTIAEFHRERLLPIVSDIDAKYVIRGTRSGDVFFVFLDEDSGEYFCRSAFKYENTDYLRNQPILTTLKVIKEVNGTETVIYQRPGFTD